MAIPLLALLLAASPGLTGDWITDDRTAVVRIARCGGGLCGRVVRVLARGVPATDVNNPDPALRSRPLVGLTVLSGFSVSGIGGRAYNPRNGRAYRATLRLDPEGTLRVTGCVMMICRSQTWTRRWSVQARKTAVFTLSLSISPTLPKCRRPLHFPR